MCQLEKPFHVSLQSLFHLLLKLCKIYSVFNCVPFWPLGTDPHDFFPLWQMTKKYIRFCDGVPIYVQRRKKNQNHRMYYLAKNHAFHIVDKVSKYKLKCHFTNCLWTFLLSVPFNSNCECSNEEQKKKQKERILTILCNNNTDNDNNNTAATATTKQMKYHTTQSAKWE